LKKSRKMMRAGHVAFMRKVRTLVGTPHGEQSLLGPRHSWKDNIKMYLREIGHEDANGIEAAQYEV
jgi:hypothetical protein